MHPLLFTIFGLPVYGFGLMVGLGIATGLFWAWQRLQQALPLHTATSLVAQLPWLAVVGLFGARAMYAVYHPALFLAEPLGFFTAGGGMVWYGAVMAGLLFVIYLARKHHVSLLRLTDVLLPPLMLGLAFGRIGCLLAGCCFGAETTLPWAIHYPQTHPTHGLGVHPVPLYEASGALALCVVSLWLESRQNSEARSGSVTALCAVGYGVLRFMNEALRGDALMVPLASAGLPELSASQWLSLTAILVGLLVLAVNSKNKTMA
jgi:phosphatidylglycerol:prolipoprotein diacylglycerol transferase